ncbi:phosphatase PAP2 family protein [Paeniroseomonas aquatica]|uniref:phosphatase PAP2 family protein n=1 Tax=Paeniroseomonas aquatica TaxID=373043 RepID=UPI00338E5D50
MRERGLRQNEFESQTAATSLTSSTFSGHCLQGIVAGCAVFEVWQHNNLLRSADSAACLAQFSVDIGDRRVFAGVHYPTDNVASWILAMNLIPHIFKEPEPILKFAKFAITERSHVYKELQKRATATVALTKPIAALDAALSI